jgi:hypothetical protein
MTLDRQQAIDLLQALPVHTVHVAQLQPDDVIVVECDVPISRENAERTRQLLQLVWPDRKVLFCDPGMRLRVLRLADTPSVPTSHGPHPPNSDAYHTLDAVAPAAGAGKVSLPQQRGA